MEYIEILRSSSSQSSPTSVELNLADQCGDRCMICIVPTESFVGIEFIYNGWAHRTFTAQEAMKKGENTMFEYCIITVLNSLSRGKLQPPNRWWND